MPSDKFSYSGENDLHSAVLLGDIQTVHQLLKQGVDVNCTEYEYGETPLYCAIKWRQVKIAELLLKHGAHTDSRCNSDSTSQTSLHLAAFEGMEEMIELLLSHGANINAENGSGETPLHLAIQKKHIKTVELLIQHKANICSESRVRDQTPLLLAVDVGSEEIVMLLLAEGANINRGGYGRTPLNSAAGNRHFKIAELLIKHGACINPSLSEFVNGNYHCPKMQFISPLHSAVLGGNEEIVKLLLLHGADINAKWYKQTPLGMAVCFRRIKIVELLLKHGACVNFTRQQDYTVLHDAACNGSEDGAKLLLLYGADVARKTKDGSTAYDIATQKGYTKFAKTLLECGNEIDCMKKQKISNSNVSFYDIVTKDLKRLTKYVMNENISHVLSSGVYKEKFLHYGCMINSNYEMAVNRRRLLIQASEHFSLVDIFNKLPCNLSEVILSYLHDEDFKNFIVACKVKFYIQN